jgi:hypothetical protein
MVKKLIEISNPNDGKGMEKFVKCYSDLTGQTEKFFVCAGNISFLKNFARRIAVELVIT